MSDASDSGRYLRKFQKIITLRAYYVTAGVKKPRLKHEPFMLVQQALHVSVSELFSLGFTSFT